MNIYIYMEREMHKYMKKKSFLRGGLETSTRKTRGETLRAMFYFECRLVQRDFLPLSEMCYDENVLMRF